MNRLRSKIEYYRIRLFDRYVSVRDSHGIPTPFEDFWYEFILRNAIADKPPDEVFDEICGKIERSDY